MEEMTFKVNVVLSILLALVHRSRGGVILESTSPEETHTGQHVSLASSFMQFLGPVEGPEFEVKVPEELDLGESNHLHGEEEQEQGDTVDYVAHPRYEFAYGVADHHTGDFHGQKESRDGTTVSGQYSVKEPGGGVRVVSYRADKDGFHAVVHTSGKNEHSAGIYPGQGYGQVHGQEGATQQEYGIHDYAAEGY